MLRHWIPLTIHFLVFLGFIHDSLAVYYIDSSDAAVQYIGTGMGWQHSVQDPDFPIDVTKVFDETFTWNKCRQLDNCHVQIPFIGSGITIYGLEGWNMNVSITIDGGSPTLFDAPTTPDFSYNHTFYNNQTLPFGSHSIDMALQPYNGGWSHIYFDYAAVNDTSTPSPFPTSTFRPAHTCSTFPHSSHTARAAAIGGSIAGVVIVIIAIAGALVYSRRRRGGYTFLPSVTKMASSSKRNVEKKAGGSTTPLNQQEVEFVHELYAGVMDKMIKVEHMPVHHEGPSRFAQGTEASSIHDFKY